MLVPKVAEGKAELRARGQAEPKPSFHFLDASEGYFKSVIRKIYRGIIEKRGGDLGCHC